MKCHKVNEMQMPDILTMLSPERASYSTHNKCGSGAMDTNVLSGLDA